jgi:hypothetical protein
VAIAELVLPLGHRRDARLRWKAKDVHVWAQTPLHRRKVPAKGKLEQVTGHADAQIYLGQLYYRQGRGGA